MNKNKKVIIAAVAIVAIIAIFIGIFVATRPETSQGSKTITVEVIHADESTKTFTYHTDEEYLGSVVLDNGLVEGDMGDYGLYITVVDGESAVYEVDGAYWSLLINGEYAMTGADQTPVNDGDAFTFAYTVG